LKKKLSNKNMNLLNPQNELEKIIMLDPEWIEGFEWGMPREGHPEGKVKNHVLEVLDNIEKLENISQIEYEKLRLIALIHDTFKYKVNIKEARIGRNNHAVIARLFAEKYIDDKSILRIIEQHDEAFNAWRKGDRDGDWEKAEKRLLNLFELLGDDLRLFSLFYKVDNELKGKNQDCLKWFEEKIRYNPKNMQKIKLKKHNPVLTFVLILLTLGIYIPIWLFRYRDEINSLAPDERISKTGSIIFAILFILPIFTLSSTLLSDFVVLPEIFDIFILFLFIFGPMINLISTILYLVMAFKIRRIIEKYNMDNKVDEKFYISGVMTFFFAFLYLDYKMGKLGEIINKK